MDTGSDRRGWAAAGAKRLVALAVLAAFVALSGCGRKGASIPPAEKDGSPVVAMVGEQPVTLAMLEVLAAQNGYDLRKSDQLELALRDAVNVELLAAEARKHGYDQDPDIQRYLKAQSIQKLLLATVDKNPQAAMPGDAELQAYYDQNLGDFTSPALIRPQVLALLKRSGEGQEAAFQQKLDAVKAAIEAKELPFSELVKQFSDDPAARNYAGITNWMVAGEPDKQYPEALVAALFASTDQGTVIGPIEHGDWVYFARVHERREGRTTPFEQAKPRIAQEIQRRQRLEAYNAFVQSLGTTAGVQVFPDKASAALAAQTKEGGPPMGPVDR